MKNSRRRTRLLLIPATAAIGIGLFATAAPAFADDFNPQPDPPGKVIAVNNFERFINVSEYPPDPCRSQCALPAVQVHKRLIAKFGGGPNGS